MAVKKFFFQKITKNRLAAGGSVPRPLAVIRLSYTTDILVQRTFIAVYIFISF